jgi:uncharacterized protein involved in response to NO
MPKPDATPPEPYRLLFPMGAAYALLGGAAWPLAALGFVPYPGLLHAQLMIEGFELSFIAGFLLTIAPRLTRTDPTPAPELSAVAALAVAFGACALAGWTTAAHASALAIVLALTFAAARRMLARRNDPPEEVVFVGTGLALGLAGTLIQLAASAGWLVEPAPRLGLRLLSLGMVLSLVLGFGAFLVPVFLEIRDPLAIPRLARPHERGARRVLYAALATSLVASFIADAWGVHAVAAWTRALVAAVLLGWVWKIGRRPGRRTVPAHAMWAAGWFVGIGLLAAALAPAHEIAALHLTLIGGFGVLTMAIATRVVVTHGGHSPNAEAGVLTPSRAALLAVALATRVAAEAAGASAPWWLAASGTAWVVAWMGWIVAAWRVAGRRASSTAAA